MCHVEIERCSLERLSEWTGTLPDALFVVPRDEAPRGVGRDPRRGLFLMLQSGARCYPLHDLGRGGDILAMRLLAVEAGSPDDPRVQDFILEALGIALGAAG